MRSLRALGVLCGLMWAAAALAQAVDPAGWRAVSGEAAALSIAADGVVLAAGRDGRIWIFRRSEIAWSPLAGDAVRIAALPAGRYYAVRRDGEVTYFDGLRIAYAGLRALDVTATPQGEIYAVRTDGRLVRRRAAANTWDEIPVTGVRRAAAAPDGALWIAFEAGGVARWAGGNLQSLPGTALDLAVGGDGTVLAIDEARRLRRRTPVGDTWDPVPGPGNLGVIALGPQNEPWIATTAGAIFTQASLPSTTLRIEAGESEGGIVFGKSRLAQRVGPARAQRGARAAGFVALNPESRVTDPAPFDWIDTLASATSLAISLEGSVFALDAGGAIGRWSNLQRRFAPYPGNFAKIAVEANGNPWGINSLGRVFRRDGPQWRQINGNASDLSIGVGGQILANTAAGALLQYDRASDSLRPLAGQLFTVTVAPDGVPWGLLPDGTVVRCPSADCRRFTRTARSLAIGPDGSVFIVTLDGQLQRLRRAQDDWEIIPVLGQRLSAVAVGPRGRPWVVAEGGRVFASAFFPRDESTDLLEASTTSNQTTGSGGISPVSSGVDAGGFVFSKNMPFQSISVPAGAQGVSLGPDGTVLMFVGTTGLVRYNRSKNVFETVTGLPSGNIRHAKFGPDGTLWIISADVDGRILHQLSGSNFETLQLPIPSPQPPVAGAMNRSINIAPDGTVYAIDTSGTIYVRPAGSTRFSKFVSGTYQNLAAPRSGEVWVIDDNFVVRQVVNGVAERRPSNRDQLADDIAGARDGSVYITTPVGANDAPAKWNANSQTWDLVNQVADFVGVQPDGRPWLWDSGNPGRILRAK